MKTLLIGLLLCGVTAQARLGEQKDQIQQRYGEPLFRDADSSKWAPAKEARFYEANDFSIIVLFDEKGQSVCETFKHKDKSPLSQTEIDSLLSANSGNATWKDSTTNPAIKIYDRSDKNACAAYRNSDKPSLAIMTTDFFEKKNSLSKSSAKSTKGF
jgi:hypothetical protein